LTIRTVTRLVNNKVHLSTKVLPFKTNYRQDPRMGFETRKKGKYEGAQKFVEKIKGIQEKAKVVLGKVQEEIKKKENEGR